MNIGIHELGHGHPTFIIAEACSNIMLHLDRLDVFVEAVANTGADALKVQLFKAEHFPEAEWESKRKVEFPRNLIGEFANLCHKHNLLWGASVFDDEAVDLCVDHEADFLKLATREWKNEPLLRKCLDTKLQLIRSYDWTQGDFHAGIYGGVYDNVIHMACIPQYPAFNFTVPNVYKLDDYPESVLWGWSSHSPDTLDVLLAVSRGAAVVEKHVRGSFYDYESGWSLSFDEFKKMVGDIRRVEAMR